MMYGWGLGGTWMWLGGLMMVAFWGGVIALIVWAVRRWGGRPEATRGPLDVAKERYARGEITREQFENLKQGLS